MTCGLEYSLIVYIYAPPPPKYGLSITLFDIYKWIIKYIIFAVFPNYWIE